MTEAEVLKWAKDNGCLYPFDGVELAGKINGNEVYGFTTTSKEPLIVGLPSFILIKDGKPEMVSGEAGLKMLDDLSHEEPK